MFGIALLLIILTTINATTQNLLTNEEDPTKGQSLLKGISASNGNVNVYSSPNTVSNPGLPQAPMQNPGLPQAPMQVGTTFNPNAIYGQIQPISQPNQFQGINTQPYQAGQPVPTNLNPNLYSGGFPGRDAGYTSANMYPRMDANAEASPRNPIGVQGLFKQPGGSLQYANPTVGGVIDQNTIQNSFGQNSNPSALVGASIGTKGLFNMLSPQPSYVTGGAPQSYQQQQSQPNSLMGTLTGSNDLFAMFGATPTQQGYGVPQQQGYGVPQQQGYGVSQQPSFGSATYNQPNSMYGVGVNSNQPGTNPSEFSNMFDGYTNVDSPTTQNSQPPSSTTSPANQATQPPHSATVNAGPATGLSFNR